MRNFIDIVEGNWGAGVSVSLNPDEWDISKLNKRTRGINESVAYPAEASCSEIYDMVYELHGPYDFEEGDITKRIERFDRYILQTLELSEINYQQWTVSDSLIDEYSAKLADGEAPPIVYDAISRSIIDGTHRAQAAVRAGRTTILAYVGTRKNRKNRNS